MSKLKLKSRKEKEWFEKMLKPLSIIWDKTPCNINESKNGKEYIGWRPLKKGDANDLNIIESFFFLESKLEHNLKCEESSLKNLSFSFKLTDCEICFYQEGKEYVNLERIAELVKMFLTEMRPDGYFYMSKADFPYCDENSDNNGFGTTACACFVKAGSIEYMDTYDWLEKKIAEQNKTDVYFVGIDGFNRPTFQSKEESDFGSGPNYYCADINIEDLILKEVNEKKLLFKGKSFGSDPKGYETNCRIVKSTELGEENE